MSTIIQFRRGTAAEWTSVNPTLAEGEKGIETDGLGTTEVKEKIGNGVLAWNDLPYQETGAVKSVNTKVGDVVIDGTDIELVNGGIVTVTEAIGDLSTEVTNLETNKLDATTSAVQTKRPIKTVNNESLEGAGNIEVLGVESLTIQLPTYIDAVVGETIQIFYQAMVNTPNYDNYHFVGKSSVSATESKSLPRYFETVPTTTGDRTLTFYVLGSNNEVLDTKTTILRVTEPIEQPNKQLYIWNIGDSFINNPTSTDELVRRLTGTGGTPIGLGYQNISVHREGNSGKEWNWYVTNEDSPFVYSGVLDFEQYRIDNSLQVPALAMINLTWNGFAFDKTDAEWITWTNDVYTFIDTLKIQFPNIDMIIVSPSMPSTNGGESVVNGANGLEIYGDEYLLKVMNLRQALIYERIKGEVGYEYLEHIQAALQVDSLYNVGSTLTDVNTRNSSAQELIGNNDVHPTDGGYYQISDSQYRKITGDYLQTQTNPLYALSFDPTNTESGIMSPKTVTGNWVLEFDITSNIEANTQILTYHNIGALNITLFSLGRIGFNAYISTASKLPTTGSFVLRIEQVGTDVNFYSDNVLVDTLAGQGGDFIIEHVAKRDAQNFDGVINSMNLDGEIFGLNEGTGTVSVGGLGTVMTLTSTATIEDMWVPE